jgi:hypothetical protein
MSWEMAGALELRGQKKSQSQMDIKSRGPKIGPESEGERMSYRSVVQSYPCHTCGVFGLDAPEPIVSDR